MNIGSRPEFEPLCWSAGGPGHNRELLCSARKLGGDGVGRVLVMRKAEVGGGGGDALQRFSAPGSESAALLFVP